MLFISHVQYVVSVTVCMTVTSLLDKITKKLTQHTLRNTQRNDGICVLYCTVHIIELYIVSYTQALHVYCIGQCALFYNPVEQGRGHFAHS